MKTCCLLVFALLALSSQVAASEETPREGLQVLLDLYVAGDFDRLVRERYTEIKKAEAAGRVDVLVQKFAKRFSSKEQLQDVIDMYEVLLEIEPEIVTNPKPRETETNRMAVFRTDDGVYHLYMQKSGKWGFHM